ncbi:MAG: dihydrofolate reductase family protein [Ruminiclostridium sp.]|nr:dihydrofolate reductase family protein [Ruminiclostridium sp.]
MDRPYIICHMAQSLDGKVTGDFLYTPACEPVTEVYYRINRDLPSQGFICGRVTMEGSFTQGWYPDLTEFAGAEIPEEDFVANPAAHRFAVSFDRRGRLGWKEPVIVDEDPGYGGCHIIQVMCQGVTPAYLAYLRKTGISYILAGSEDLDIPLALEKLKNLFGIETLLLEGGSIINGAFHRAGLIDQLSLVVAPVTGADQDHPLFYGYGEEALDGYTLTEQSDQGGNVVWRRYKRKK